MNKISKKTYISPKLTETPHIADLMQVPISLPQGNNDDPVVDDEDDILTKEHEIKWGNLW